jgi:hypothetical protein
MRTAFAVGCTATLLATLLVGSAAGADSWKDKSEKYRWFGYEDQYRGELVRERSGWKEEVHADGCTVERKWDRKDGYKEEVKCDRRRR